MQLRAWAHRRSAYAHWSPLYLLSTLNVTHVIKYSRPSNPFLYRKQRKAGRGLRTRLGFTYNRHFCTLPAFTMSVALTITCTVSRWTVSYLIQSSVFEIVPLSTQSDFVVTLNEASTLSYMYLRYLVDAPLNHRPQGFHCIRYLYIANQIFSLFSNKTSNDYSSNSQWVSFPLRCSLMIYFVTIQLIPTFNAQQWLQFKFRVPKN